MLLNLSIFSLYTYDDLKDLRDILYDSSISLPGYTIIFNDDYTDLEYAIHILDAVLSAYNKDTYEIYSRIYRSDLYDILSTSYEDIPLLLPNLDMSTSKGYLSSYVFKWRLGIGK